MEKALAPHIMVLDGNNLIHRAYHGMRPLSTSDGMPTHAVYGFLSILGRLLVDYPPDGLCVVFDLPGGTFRDALFDGYKAGRGPMDDDLAVQLPLLREVLAAMRIPVYDLAGFEADDLMGVMARISAERGWLCSLVTGDRDSYQLIGERVRVLRVGNKETRVMTVETLFEEYGLTPGQMIDLKALMGDTSDRIPGVAGVGEKTALLLMREYGSLDEIYARLDDIPEKFRKKLVPGKESAYLSKKLGTIDCFAPLDFDPERTRRQAPDRDVLGSVFARLEFRNLLGKWLNTIPSVPSESGQQVSFLPQSDPDGKGVYDSLPEGVGRDVKAIWRADIEAGRPLTNLSYDSSLAAWMLGRPEAAWDDMRAQMDAEGIWELYRDVEMPLCKVLARMETYGVAVDRGKLEDFSRFLGHRLDEIKTAAREMLGREVNLLSPKQLGELLFEELKLPHGKKNKTGYSTDADTLEQLRELHPIVPVILETRMLAKLKSTYADGLLKAADGEGRIHSTFQMTATVTGRLSSTEPNLQNIPIRQEFSAKLREMFIPSQPGWMLVDADYSQIELRVLAHIAQDEAMRGAFASGQDIHAATAAQVFGVPMEDVTPAMRRNAKAVNFGIVYGISDFSLAADIGVTRAEARAYIDSYLGRYDGVRTYMRDIVDKARENGFVTTLFGRRRYIPEVRSKNYHIRSFGERAALNAPIQGTAADIIKMAMVTVSNRLEREGLQARLVLQVHDELIVECPEAEVATVKALLQEEMETVCEINPRLVAEAHAGENWAAAK